MQLHNFWSMQKKKDSLCHVCFPESHPNNKSVVCLSSIVIVIYLEHRSWPNITITTNFGCLFLDAPNVKLVIPSKVPTTHSLSSSLNTSFNIRAPYGSILSFNDNPCYILTCSSCSRNLLNSLLCVFLQQQLTLGI